MQTITLSKSEAIELQGLHSNYMFQACADSQHSAKQEKSASQKFSEYCESLGLEYMAAERVANTISYFYDDVISKDSVSISFDVESDFLGSVA